MKRIIYFVLILVTFIECANAQEQILNLHLTKTDVTNIHIDSNSYISWGSVDVKNPNNDQILLHEVDRDSAATIFANFEYKDSNDVFVGFKQKDSVIYYGALFRNDSCFAYNDSLPIYLANYSFLDSVAVVKCEGDIQIFVNDTILFEYNLDTFPFHFDIICQLNEAKEVPHMLMSYYLYGLCDTLLPPEPDISPTFISLNYQYNKSYAVVEGDFLYLRYYEKYHSVFKNDTVTVMIYSDDNSIQAMHQYQLENYYGNNFQSIDLTQVPGILDNAFYKVVLLGSNKETELFLRIYKYAELPPDITTSISGPNKPVMQSKK